MNHDSNIYYRFHLWSNSNDDFRLFKGMVSMREKTNCPNCGAPINSTVCPYCGTAFYDFSAISFDRPTYIRVQMNGELYVAKVQARQFMINMESGVMPQIDMEFSVLPDDKGVYFIRHER